MNLGPSGYSGTPLAKKLGIKPGSTFGVVYAPDGFVEGLIALEPGAIQASGDLDVLLLFATRQAELEAALPGAIESLKRDGGLWVCWPKKASKVPTDITEDLLRTIILPMGLVDNKVCAVTEVWSGLRFVWRKELR